MDAIDRNELQSNIFLLYYLVAISFFVWWLIGQIVVASGAIQTIPDQKTDLFRLAFAMIALSIGMIRSRWTIIKYPSI